MQDFKVSYDDNEDILYLAKKGQKVTTSLIRRFTSMLSMGWIYVNISIPVPHYASEAS